MDNELIFKYRKDMVLILDMLFINFMLSIINSSNFHKYFSVKYIFVILGIYIFILFVLYIKIRLSSDNLTIHVMYFVTMVISRESIISVEVKGNVIKEIFIYYKDNGKLRSFFIFYFLNDLDLLINNILIDYIKNEKHIILLNKLAKRKPYLSRFLLFILIILLLCNVATLFIILDPSIVTSNALSLLH